MSQESKLVFRESPWEQSVHETVSYKVTVPTSWGSNPASPALTVIRRSDNEDVTSTVASGPSTVAGQVITTAPISGIAATDYILKVRFSVDGGNILEPYGRLRGVDPNAA